MNLSENSFITCRHFIWEIMHLCPANFSEIIIFKFFLNIRLISLQFSLPMNSNVFGNSFGLFSEIHLRIDQAVPFYQQIFSTVPLETYSVFFFIFLVALFHLWEIALRYPAMPSGIPSIFFFLWNSTANSLESCLAITFAFENFLAYYFMDFRWPFHCKFLEIF